MLNFWIGSILILSSKGTRSRRAAFLISEVLRFCGSGSGVEATGTSGAGLRTGSAGAGAGAPGTASSGMFSMASSGAIGSGAGATISSFGSGKGPTGSPSSPVSPSGTEDGAATGSEKTGSMLVVLVMSSIAFCKSLSTVG